MPRELAASGATILVLAAVGGELATTDDPDQRTVAPLVE